MCLIVLLQSTWRLWNDAISPSGSSFYRSPAWALRCRWWNLVLSSSGFTCSLLSVATALWGLCLYSNFLMTLGFAVYVISKDLYVFTRELCSLICPGCSRSTWFKSPISSLRVVRVGSIGRPLLSGFQIPSFMSHLTKLNLHQLSYRPNIIINWFLWISDLLWYF